MSKIYLHSLQNQQAFQKTGLSFVREQFKKAYYTLFPQTRIVSLVLAVTFSPRSFFIFNIRRNCPWFTAYSCRRLRYGGSCGGCG
ncbi:hypothetical protein CW304_19735 [Bacillus sp. UFRGS-B20]|nr:hypothetical protein CW304_19735 [Bacillus sp. UFRGS-B20]